LIIDVRENGGGWDDFGFKLFSYLIKKPTRYYDSLYTMVTDVDFLIKHTDKDSAWLKESENVWWKNGKPLPNSISEGLSLQQPQQNRFEGNVYVLMNGKSMSTTAEFTAATHFNNLATFVGDESGGVYEGGNGADFVSVILPNTQLFLNIPLAKYVMTTSGELKGRGTIPHYQVKKTVKDWLELRDPQLDFVLELINKETK
jgi:C-terminal processing protease CtpA/Prc